MALPSLLKLGAEKEFLRPVVVVFILFYNALFQAIDSRRDFKKLEEKVDFHLLWIVKSADNLQQVFEKDPSQLKKILTCLARLGAELNRGRDLLLKYAPNVRKSKFISGLDNKLQMELCMRIDVEMKDLTTLAPELDNKNFTTKMINKLVHAGRS